MSFKERERAVLRALARIGKPVTLHELQSEVSEVGMHAILRTLDVLERRGLTRSSGNRAWVFLGDGRDWHGFGFGPDEVVRFSLAGAELPA